jgi:DNA-binding NtrC family response regulator
MPISVSTRGDRIVRILVVDDEEVICDLIAGYLEQFGYVIEKADSVKAAQELLHARPYDILITDKNMPDGGDVKEGGLGLLRYTKEHRPEIEVIMMTGYGTIETAVEAMRLGAFDYVTKPFKMEELKEKILRIEEYKQFLSNEHSLQVYRTIHKEMLELLENKANLPEEEINTLLKSLGRRIDYLFGAQKEWEKIINLQQEALLNISRYAEELEKQVAESDPARALVQMISLESKKRL